MILASKHLILTFVHIVAKEWLILPSHGLRGVSNMEAQEIKYWVIKNPDTGLYYRGKGENRWGKYYNQASIFRIRGQVEESCNWINRCHRDGERAVIVEIKISEVLVEDGI